MRMVRIAYTVWGLAVNALDLRVPDLPQLGHRLTDNFTTCKSRHQNASQLSDNRSHTVHEVDLGCATGHDHPAVMLPCIQSPDMPMLPRWPAASCGTNCSASKRLLAKPARMRWLGAFGRSPIAFHHAMISS